MMEGRIGVADPIQERRTIVRHLISIESPMDAAIQAPTARGGGRARRAGRNCRAACRGALQL